MPRKPLKVRISSDRDLLTKENHQNDINDSPTRILKDDLSARAILPIVGAGAGVGVEQQQKMLQREFNESPKKLASSVIELSSQMV